MIRSDLARQFLTDERGAGSPIEFVLVLPLFLLLLIGAYQVWQVISIRESLDRGVLQAAEYWSTCYAIRGDEQTACKYTAERIILGELANNSLLKAWDRAGKLRRTDFTLQYFQHPDADARRRSLTEDPDSLEEFRTFTIEARLAVPWAVDLPFMEPRRLVIRAAHTAFKEKPYIPPTPTPTPTASPTPAAILPGGSFFRASTMTPAPSR